MAIREIGSKITTKINNAIGKISSKSKNAAEAVQETKPETVKNMQAAEASYGKANVAIQKKAKKPYVAPKTEVIETKTEANLMVGSPTRGGDDIHGGNRGEILPGDGGSEGDVGAKPYNAWNDEVGEWGNLWK